MSDKDFFENKYVDFLKYLEQEFELSSNQAVVLSLNVLETIPVLIKDNQILKEMFARNAAYIKEQNHE